MVYPHTSNKSESKHVQLVSLAKEKDIRAACMLYLANIIIQGHDPQNKSQESTNKLSKEAVKDYDTPKVEDKKAFRYFKLSCDGMLRDEIYALMVCVSPVEYDPRVHRIHMLCQDIVIQTRRQGRFRHKRKRRR